MNEELKTSPLGPLIIRLYGRIPLKQVVLRWVVRREGGQFRSGTLRRLLQSQYAIEVGPHSYGSLLDPGMCDPYTRIGSYVSVGPNVRRFGASHPVAALSMHPYWYNPSFGYVGDDKDVERSSCVIEDEVWIGANVTILPACRRIGVGAVIGAGSVVTGDVPDFTIVAGNPARVIGERLTDEQRETLLRLLDSRPTAAHLSQVLVPRNS